MTRTRLAVTVAALVFGAFATITPVASATAPPVVVPETLTGVPADRRPMEHASGVFEPGPASCVIDPPNGRSLVGAEGDGVLCLRRQLSRSGIEEVGSDRVWDPQLVEALRMFAGDRRPVPSGSDDPTLYPIVIFELGVGQDFDPDSWDVDGDGDTDDDSWDESRQDVYDGDWEIAQCVDHVRLGAAAAGAEGAVRFVALPDPQTALVYADVLHADCERIVISHPEDAFMTGAALALWQSEHPDSDDAYSVEVGSADWCEAAELVGVEDERCGS